MSIGGLPDPGGEDAFVASLRDGVHDEAVVLDALWLAMESGRMRLAARLVGLLEEDHDDPVVDRARRAAAMMVHERLGPADVSWAECDEALRALRARRMDRARRRIRDRVSAGTSDRTGRLDRGRRRR